MRCFNINESFKGWFVGNFSSSILRTDTFEVALKRYHSGDCEQKHVHRVATEITLVVEGTILMNGVSIATGQAIRLDPGEPCAFSAVTDATTIVIKTPSTLNDKFFVD